MVCLVLLHWSDQLQVLLVRFKSDNALVMAYKSSRRHQEPSSSGGGPHLVMGRTPCSHSDHSSHSRSEKLADGLPQWTIVVTRRVGSPPTSIQGSLSMVEYAGRGSVGIQFSVKLDRFVAKTRYTLGFAVCSW